MGCCFPDTGAIHSVTDSKLNYEQMLFMQNNCIKLIVLGTSGSGKTTITKQLQQINGVYEQNCHSQDNILMLIHNTIIRDIKTLCQHKQISANRNVNDLVQEIISLHPPYIITPHVADIIKQLYNDTSIQTTLKQRYNYGLNICDSIEYFVNKIDEIGVHGYIPTFDDSIRVHSQTNGYSICKFVKNIDNYGKYMFEMADIGGAQSERRKWWHPKLLLDPDLNTIIYVVDISEYNMVLFDNKHRISVSDDRTNKLMDSINTFRQLIESMNETFENKSIILLFNKYDLFKDKIKTIPISVTFDVSNDINPNNPDDVIRFIACQFSNVFKQCRITLKYPLQIIRTVGIDTNSIKAMFDTILSKIIVKCINSKNKNENETFKAEMDGFDAPLISVPTLVNHPYSTPAIHHNLPKLKVRSQNHSLPIFTETHSLPIFTESSDAKKIVFTESTDI